MKKWSHKAQSLVVVRYDAPGLNGALVLRGLSWRRNRSDTICENGILAVLLVLM